MPPGSTTLTYKTVQMSSPHFVMYWEDLSWSPLAKEQFSADVNVTLQAALERSVVESAESCTR